MNQNIRCIHFPPDDLYAEPDVVCCPHICPTDGPNTKYNCEEDAKNCHSTVWGKDTCSGTWDNKKCKCDCTDITCDSGLQNAFLGGDGTCICPKDPPLHDSCVSCSYPLIASDTPGTCACECPIKDSGDCPTGQVLAPKGTCGCQECTGKRGQMVVDYERFQRFYLDCLLSFHDDPKRAHHNSRLRAVIIFLFFYCLSILLLFLQVERK